MSLLRFRRIYKEYLLWNKKLYAPVVAKSSRIIIMLLLTTSLSVTIALMKNVADVKAVMNCSTIAICMGRIMTVACVSTA